MYKIPKDFGNFDRKIALELLNLIEEAYNQLERYQEAQKQKTTESNSNWEDDLTPIDSNVRKYEILANLASTQNFLLDKSKRVPFGFIAKKKNTQNIYIIFRGTVTPKEWINNLKFTQSSYQKKDNHKICNSIDDSITGEIHRGFLKTYTNKEQINSIKFKIEETLKNCPENTRIFIAGHSLGGALATIAAFHIHFSTVIPFKNPTLYSFASPRVGDRDFAGNFQQLTESYRIANSEDIIPKVPIISLLLASARLPGKSGAASLVNDFSSKLDYQHVGVPIYFTLGNNNIVDHHSLETYRQALL